MLISEIYRRAVEEMYPGTSALILHSDTHVQPRGTVEFIREYCECNNCSLIVAEPKTTFGKIVKQYGLPRVRLQEDHAEPECCRYLKNEPADELYKEMGIRAIIIGLTKEESHNRRMFAGRCGDYYYAKLKDRRQIYPILEYKERDVWDAHKLLNMSHHPFYDQCPGHRLGCLPCTSYISWQKRMPIESPKWYEWVRKQRHQELLFPMVGEGAVG